MSIHVTSLLHDCVTLHSKVHLDSRGVLDKRFQADAFAALGVGFAVREAFFTKSVPRVLRGMHVQSGMHPSSKLVACLAGRIVDVVLDLRPGSPTAWRHASVELAADDGVTVFVPEGVAHGFAVLEGPAMVAYLTSREHCPECDTGVHWSSCGISWPVSDPLVSPRDAAFPTLSQWRAGGAPLQPPHAP